MQQIIVDDFSLNHTLNSGQFFYFYTNNDDGYIIIHRNSIFKVKQIDNVLYYSGISKEELIYFFHLDFNLNLLIHPNIDSHSLAIITTYKGLRILRQDLWQCIIGFVCSAAANIDKIKTNVELISYYFGEKVEFDGRMYYLFPEPGALDNEALLREAKTGYRAKFLYEINKIIKNDPELLEKIRSSSKSEARALLTTLPGIGSKIADCILLFALQDYEAFPVDTWVSKIFNKYYLEEELTPKQIEKVVDYYFPKGNYRGIIQQYLFHYERNNFQK